MNLLKTTIVLTVALLAAPAVARADAPASAPIPITVQIAGAQSVAVPDLPALTASVDDALNRGAQYWGSAPGCQAGVQVIYDQTMTGASGASAMTPGCIIWIGDYFVGRFSQLERCRDLVHEWGHLLGHLHVPSGDPDDVMPYQTDADGYAYINTARTCAPDVAVTADAPAMVATAWDAQQHLLFDTSVRLSVPPTVQTVATPTAVRPQGMYVPPAKALGGRLIHGQRISHRKARALARAFARHLRVHR